MDPLELPAYRFYNLLIFHLKEGRSEEQLAALEASLVQCDLIKHPLHEQYAFKPLITAGRARSVDPEAPAERPIELVKAEEAQQRGKPFRVPEWWVGEDKAAKTAMVAMQTLPK